MITIFESFVNLRRVPCIVLDTSNGLLVGNSNLIEIFGKHHLTVRALEAEKNPSLNYIQLANSVHGTVFRENYFLVIILNVDSNNIENMVNFINRSSRKDKKELFKSWAAMDKNFLIDKFRIDIKSLLELAIEKSILMNEREAIQAKLHEIQTPISSLRTALESSTFSKKEMVLEELSEIRLGLETMVSVVNQDLKFDKNAFMEMNVGAFINDLKPNYEKRAQKKGFGIDVLFCPFKMRVIPQRFELAVTNLLQNAIKYSFENSNPENKNANIKILFEHADRQGTIRIVNNGYLIPEADILDGRIFRKFERGSLKKRNLGTGLGLYLVKQIIENEHSGIVRIESKSLSGRSDGMARTTVSITLPIL